MLLFKLPKPIQTRYLIGSVRLTLHQALNYAVALQCSIEDAAISSLTIDQRKGNVQYTPLIPSREGDIRLLQPIDELITVVELWEGDDYTYNLLKTNSLFNQ